MEDHQSKEEFKPLGRCLRWNLIALLVYTVIFIFIESSSDGTWFMFAMMVSVGLHAAVNLLLMIVSFVLRKGEWAVAFLFSSLLVLVVGFSACAGVGAGIGAKAY